MLIYIVRYSDIYNVIFEVVGYLNTAGLFTFSDLISDHFDLLQDSTELSVQSRELRFGRFFRQFSIRNFPAGSIKNIVSLLCLGTALHSAMKLSLSSSSKIQY